MKRKIIAAALIASMAFGVCACSNGNQDDASKETVVETEAAESEDNSDETEDSSETEVSEEAEESLPDGFVNISGEELTMFYADDSVEISAGNIHRNSYGSWVMDLEVTNLDPENSFFMQFNRTILNGYFVYTFFQPGQVSEGETKQMTMYLGPSEITDTPAEFTAEIELLYFHIDDKVIGEFTFITDDYGYEEPDKTTEFPIIETEEAAVYLLPEFSWSEEGDRFYLNLYCEKYIEFDDDHDYVDIRATNYILNGASYSSENANRPMALGCSRCIFNPTGTTDMNKPANYGLDENTTVQTLEFDLELGANWHRETYANVHVVLSIDGDTVSVLSVTEIPAE